MSTGFRRVVRALRIRAEGKQHWYRVYVGECPVCGKDKGYRERVYGPPPADPRKRYVQMPDTETYDNCLG